MSTTDRTNADRRPVAPAEGGAATGEGADQSHTSEPSPDEGTVEGAGVVGRVGRGTGVGPITPHNTGVGPITPHNTAEGPFIPDKKRRPAPPEG
jgi:hypothetical protein